MDTRLVKAGVIAAFGLILLVPTFNALNASYVENVSPPPWMPTPPTPPDMTPPTNFKPPPDMTPPTDWQGKMPPDMCPPPVFRNLKEMNTNDSYSPGEATNGVSWASAPLRFTVPNGTIALGGYVNYTDWQAATIRAALTDPAGKLATQNQTSSGGPAGLPQRGSDEAGSFFMNSYQFNRQQPPAAGAWTLQLSAETPVQFEVHTEFGLLLACGGLMST